MQRHSRSNPTTNGPTTNGAHPHEGAGAGEAKAKAPESTLRITKEILDAVGVTQEEINALNIQMQRFSSLAEQKHNDAIQYIIRKFPGTKKTTDIPKEYQPAVKKLKNQYKAYIETLQQAQTLITTFTQQAATFHQQRYKPLTEFREAYLKFVDIIINVSVDIIATNVANVPGEQVKKVVDTFNTTFENIARLILKRELKFYEKFYEKHYNSADVGKRFILREMSVAKSLSIFHSLRGLTQLISDFYQRFHRMNQDFWRASKPELEKFAEEQAEFFAFDEEKPLKPAVINIEAKAGAAAASPEKKSSRASKGNEPNVANRASKGNEPSMVAYSELTDHNDRGKIRIKLNENTIKTAESELKVCRDTLTEAKNLTSQVAITLDSIEKMADNPFKDFDDEVTKIREEQAKLARKAERQAAREAEALRKIEAENAEKEQQRQKALELDAKLAQRNNLIDARTKQRAEQLLFRSLVTSLDAVAKIIPDLKIADEVKALERMVDFLAQDDIPIPDVITKEEKSAAPVQDSVTLTLRRLAEAEAKAPEVKVVELSAETKAAFIGKLKQLQAAAKASHDETLSRLIEERIALQARGDASASSPERKEITPKEFQAIKNPIVKMYAALHQQLLHVNLDDPGQLRRLPELFANAIEQVAFNPRRAIEEITGVALTDAQYQAWSAVKSSDLNKREAQIYHRNFELLQDWKSPSAMVNAFNRYTLLKDGRVIEIPSDTTASRERKELFACFVNVKPASTWSDIILPDELEEAYSTIKPLKNQLIDHLIAIARGQFRVSSQAADKAKAINDFNAVFSKIVRIANDKAINTRENLEQMNMMELMDLLNNIHKKYPVTRKLTSDAMKEEPPLLGKHVTIQSQMSNIAYQDKHDRTLTTLNEVKLDWTTMGTISWKPEIARLVRKMGNLKTLPEDKDFKTAMREVQEFNTKSAAFTEMGRELVSKIYSLALASPALVGAPDKKPTPTPSLYNSILLCFQHADERGIPNGAPRYPLEPAPLTLKKMQQLFIHAAGKKSSEELQKSSKHNEKFLGAILGAVNEFIQNQDLKLAMAQLSGVLKSIDPAYDLKKDEVRLPPTSRRSWGRS